MIDSKRSENSFHQALKYLGFLHRRMTANELTILKKYGSQLQRTRKNITGIKCVRVTISNFNA